MSRLIVLAFAVSSAAQVAFPQQAKPFPSYKTQEEYCAANPKMPTCIKLGTQKLNLTGMTDQQQESIRRLAGTSKSKPTPSATVKFNAIPVSVTGGKPDWRFAHPNAVALIILHVRAILASPLFETVLSQVTGQLGARFPGLN